MTAAEMNAQARALGMEHTIYTDPSGFDPSTVSTAADQLRAFVRAMRSPVFRRAGQGSDTPALLAGAGRAATQVADSVAPASRVRTIAVPGAHGPGGHTRRRGPPLLHAPGRAPAQN
jgi:hypothetical protein